MNCSQIWPYLSNVLEFWGNSNGRWLATSFFGDPHHFTTSLWSVASNVSKHRSKIRFHARINRCNLISSWSGSCKNAYVRTKSCLDLFNTSYHLVYCNHGSTSTSAGLANNVNRRSCFSSCHCWISPSNRSYETSSSASSSVASLESGLSSPTSRTMSGLAGGSGRASSSTTQYRSLLPLNHDCIRTIENISSSLALFFPCSLFTCWRVTLRFWLLNGQSLHWNPST